MISSNDFKCQMSEAIWMDYFHLNVDREQLLSMSSLGLAHLGD